MPKERELVDNPDLSLRIDNEVAGTEDAELLGGVALLPL